MEGLRCVAGRIAWAGLSSRAARAAACGVTIVAVAMVAKAVGQRAAVLKTVAQKVAMVVKAAGQVVRAGPVAQAPRVVRAAVAGRVGLKVVKAVVMLAVTAMRRSD